MDDNAINGYRSLFGSIILGIISWFSPEYIDLTLKVVTGIGAMIGIFFAARYHYYAAQEKKERIRKLRDGEKN